MVTVGEGVRPLFWQFVDLAVFFFQVVNEILGIEWFAGDSGG